MPERIPPPPTQALTSTTFVPPPHDLSLTIPEIIDFHRVHSPKHVVYVYEEAPGVCKQEFCGHFGDTAPDLKPLIDATIVIMKEQGSEIPVVQPMPAFAEVFPDDDSGDLSTFSNLKPTARLRSQSRSLLRVATGSVSHACHGTEIATCEVLLSAVPVFHGPPFHQPFRLRISSTRGPLLQRVTSNDSDLIFCVLMFVELWAKDPVKVEYFKTIHGLVLSGTDVLRTEMGTVTETLPKEMNGEWEWFSFSSLIKPHLIPDGHGAYEVVVESTPTYRACVHSTKIGDADLYSRTSDLVIPHPTLPGYRKILGRADDQLMHRTGKKDVLNGDPPVKSAVMFGRGRFNPGVIIDPKLEFAFDLEDQEKLADFRNKVWLFKEMVLVSSPKKPFILTAKLTARRQAVIAEYEPEIDALYDAVDESAQAVKYFPRTWTEENSLGNVLNVPVEEDDDNFQHSCDSRQATWIRESVLNALRNTTKLNTRGISAKSVYQNPTVSVLWRIILDLTLNGVSRAIGQHGERDVGSCGKIYPGLPCSQARLWSGAQGCGVLITGTTGAIGSNTLAKLYEAPDVLGVIVISRKSTTPIALEDRGLDSKIFGSPKIVLLEGDPAYRPSAWGMIYFWSSSQPSLTFCMSVCENERVWCPQSNVRAIVLGWSVDFNLGLSSFEPNVASVRNLINVCDHQWIQPIKWVSERILEIAAEKTSLRLIIVRVGQISGGVSGCWILFELIPGIVRYPPLTKSLTSLARVISLLPLETTARALVQILGAGTTRPAVHLHLVNPTPCLWDDVFGYIAKELNVPLGPHHVWISKLKGVSGTVKNVQEHPTLRLLGFYEAIDEGNGSEAGGLASCGTEVARSVCPVLDGEDLRSVKTEEIQRWLGYWKSLGLLKLSRARSSTPDLREHR
ncbi:hypothetical protein BJ322DRAFT_1020862 [Thelephora terrestris]|uniref:Uncharacterized protein n=1 Tax=Thelephora terrestris TaxID=56493 RepID=A0A9P6HEG0_9AGAM|nr:hypothetical protein BJ322DRAFT_1020862 [Thelephora terrestris]